MSGATMPTAARREGSAHEYALFVGCAIPARVPAYGLATRAVLGRLGVGLRDLPFACCGRPVRGVDRDAFVFAAIRNLALAERDGLDVIAPCKCCYGNLRHAARFMDEDAALRARVNALLAEEGLAWRGRVEVIHLLTVLARVVGPDALAAAAVAPRTGLRVAASYGCHALRPSDVTRFDNPFVPTLFETLVRATGAEPVDWSRRLECCGDPLLDANAPLSDRIARGKIGSAREAGADAICTACPHCHVRLADAQARAAAPVAGSPPSLPLILYPQLLGLAMGISRADLGLE